jgi:hypothetical protein
MVRLGETMAEVCGLASRGVRAPKSDQKLHHATCTLRSSLGRLVSSGQLPGLLHLDLAGLRCDTSRWLGPLRAALRCWQEPHGRRCEHDQRSATVCNKRMASG